MTKYRFATSDSDDDNTYIVDFLSITLEAKACTKFCRAAVLLAALLLAGCTREEATTRLKKDLQPDTMEIVHARFPCRSPDIHLFGYRFRIFVKEEMALGDICWHPIAREWTWQILPEYPLSRLNSRK
jgi:hypothetical protein